MTAAEMEQRMTSAEMGKWMVLFSARSFEAEHQQRKAALQAQLQAGSQRR